MANNNAPFGCNIIGNGGGVGPNFEMREFKVASNDSTAIGNGDPVKMLDTGYVARFTAGTAASQFMGIMQSCKYYSVSQGKNVFMPYWPGSDASGDVTVYCTPVQLAMPVQFLIQSSGTAITRADVGLNGDFSMGSVTNGRSGATINQATLAVTATFPMRIIDVYSAPSGAPGADAASSYNWVVCTANVFQNTGL